MKRTCAAAVLVLAMAVLAPSAAGAVEVDSRVVARTSGVEIASQVLSRLDSVELGSTGVTVTVDAAGVSRDIRVDLGEVGRGLTAEGGSARGLAEMAAIPVLGGALLRALRFLARLGAA